MFFPKALVILCCIFPSLASAQSSRPALAVQARKPTPLVIHNSRMLKVMTAELEAPNLRRTYRKHIRVSKVTPNEYDPAVRDTLLLVSTASDQLKIFTNQYNSFLLSARITSRAVSFGRGIRVGTNQVAFCQAFGVSNKHEVYQVIESPEEGYSITFFFKAGTLSRVEYEVHYFG
jgi:hypothetical protein